MESYSDRIIKYAYTFDDLSIADKKYVIQNYNENNKNELCNRCKKKKYTPVLANFFCKMQIDYDFWEEKYLYYMSRNRSLIFFIDKIFNEFHSIGANKILLYENFGALLASGTDVALYASGDVDLYADISERTKIDKVLHGNGYSKINENSFNANFRVGYAGKLGDELFRINIMFIPIYRKKMPLLLNLENLIDWNNLRSYKDTNIKLPSKEALLYLSLLRISAHGYVKSPDTRLYIDIYNCSVENPDWKEIIKYAENDNTIVRIAAAAIIANSVFKIKIPKQITDLEKYNYKIKRIVDIVVDKKYYTLNLKPNYIERIILEIYSNNDSILKGLYKFALPNSDWLKKNYNSTSYFKAYLKYLLSVSK